MFFVLPCHDEYAGFGAAGVVRGCAFIQEASVSISLLHFLISTFLPILTSVHEMATVSRNYLESRKVFFDREVHVFKIKHCLTLHAHSKFEPWEDIHQR